MLDVYSSLVDGKTMFSDKMWEVEQAIEQNCSLEIEYCRLKGLVVEKRKVRPVKIMFSEGYFYMVAFIDGKDENLFPTTYRIDRIKVSA